MRSPRVEIHGSRVDLFLKREIVAFSWPYGEPMEWERFSFPVAGLKEVEALVGECAGRSHKDARAIVKARERGILWPSGDSK